jgi:hypothetical protein
MDLQIFRTCVLQEDLIEMTARKACNVRTVKNQLERVKVYPIFEHVFERPVSMRAGLDSYLVSATWKKQYWSFESQNEQTYNIDIVVFVVHVFVQK